MKKWITALLLLPFFLHLLTAQDELVYHNLRTDENGMIVPWFDKDPGVSYDHVIKLVWNFWINMRVDLNGLPYYFNHQVWDQPLNDKRGLGGDQLNMALSSWQLLYQYSGDERVKENMALITDYYLSHSLSPPDHLWPNVPYPYNNLIYSGTYDGDMILGPGFFQPDKAGTFGAELINMFKLWSKEDYPNETYLIYLKAAIKIANTLADHIEEGDFDHSPLPFKVHTETGEIGPLRKGNWGDQRIENIGRSSYTTNWAGTLELFDNLISLHQGDTNLYRQGYDQILNWMKKYPMQNNRWGPFFEDIPGWSDTQINAMTWARFIMTHPSEFEDWQQEVEKIIDWVYLKLANSDWSTYGVVAVNEQTAYLQPGNSHTARQAADELLYYSLLGREDKFDAAIRQLNWATYMVDHDGKNFYPTNAVWLTDGYGDYVRHYLRAMAALPMLAPPGNHLLATTSTIIEVVYDDTIDSHRDPSLAQDQVLDAHLFYRTYDQAGSETIRLENRPTQVLLDGKAIKETSDPSAQGFYWTDLSQGGVLHIHRENGTQIIVVK